MSNPTTTTMATAIRAILDKGGVRECPKCEGKQWVESNTTHFIGDLPVGSLVACPRCSGSGTVRYWDLTAGVWEGSRFVSWREYRDDEFRTEFRIEVGDEVGLNAALRAIHAAVDAGEAVVLVHDGTELGARCAEVVVRVIGGMR